MVDSCRQGDPSVQDTAAVSSEGCCDAGAALLHCDVILSWPRVPQCGDDPASSEMRAERVQQRSGSWHQRPCCWDCRSFTRLTGPGQARRTGAGVERRSAAPHCAQLWDTTIILLPLIRCLAPNWNQPPDDISFIFNKISLFEVKSIFSICIWRSYCIIF